MQFGLSAAPSIPGLELAAQVRNGVHAAENIVGNTGNANAAGEGGTGFEALLAALVAGGNNAPNTKNVDELGLDKANPDTVVIAEALAGLAEALKPLAKAFDNLQIPSSEQLDVARAALGKLVESINAHPNRANISAHGPIGAFAGQLSELRQAGTDLEKVGSSDFAKVGQLLERLDKILSQLPGQLSGQVSSAAPAPLNQNNSEAKAPLNIHQMIERLTQLASDLPTLPEQFSTSTVARPQFGGSALHVQAGIENPALGGTSPTGQFVDDAAAQQTLLQQKIAEQPNTQASQANTQVNQVNAQASQINTQVNPTTPGTVNKEAEPDILAQLANLGQQASGEAKKREKPAGQTNFINNTLNPGENAEAPKTFGQASREANLQAAATYPGAAKPPQAPATATAPLPTELDAVETGTEKLLAQHKIESFQQQTNHVEAAQARTGPRQVNIPGVAFEIVRQVRQGAQQFEIRLDPPEMGRIDVKMEMDGNNVTARLVVERAETLDFLQRDARALERALQQAGLNADRANLEFSLKQDGQKGSGQSQNGHQDQLNLADHDISAQEQAKLSETTIYRGTASPGGLNVWV
ncbi:flagellar hook-length control protein FliK [Maritalea sp.]|uniref:flagellar hook-length control protein FliK n=1 Tax=Maritalea sp. TaxID=2003361 RepID=UPI003EF0996C